MIRLALALACALQPAAAHAQSWTYRYTDQQFGRHKAEFTVEASAPDSPQYTLRDVGGGKSAMEYLPRALVEGRAPENWPAPSGYPTYATPYLEWKYSVRAHGWETVAVPAGTFKALRVVVSGERGKDPDPFWWPKQAARFEHTIWYAPEAGRYVRARHRAWNMTQADFADDLVELVAYRPAK